MMSTVLDEVLAIFACDRAWVIYPCDPQAASWTFTMERATSDFPLPAHLAPESDVPMDPDGIEIMRTARACDGPVRFGPGSEHQLPPAATRINLQSQMSMAIYPKGDR